MKGDENVLYVKGEDSISTSFKKDLNENKKHRLFISWDRSYPTAVLSIITVSRTNVKKTATRKESSEQLLPNPLTFFLNKSNNNNNEETDGGEEEGGNVFSDTSPLIGETNIPLNDGRKETNNKVDAIADPKVIMMI